MDPRIADWAELLVNYAMDVEEGDVVEITYGPEARELALETYRQVLQAGGHHPGQPRAASDEFSRVFYEEADDDQLTDVRDWQYDKVEDIDARVKISAPRNEREMSAVPAENRQQAQRARMDLREELLNNTKWVGTQYPTRALAQKAGMSYEAYYDFVLDACVKDWAAEAETYEPLKDIVDAGSEVRITAGDDTALTFSIGERDGVNRVGVLSDGTHNIPGGEVFTAPIRDTVEGEIRFELPAMVGGKEVSGIRLTFEDGKITEYDADQGEELLDEQLNADEGARYLGEFGIGTNFDITEPTRDILFDEKIGGTIHLAVGRAYPSNLAVDRDSIDHDGVDDDRFEEIADAVPNRLDEGTYTEWMRGLPNHERAAAANYREAMAAKQEQLNQSTTHWDMIKDLRDDGRLEIDGETIMENGRFVAIDTLP